MLKIQCDQSARTSDPGAFSLSSTVIENERRRTCTKCGFTGVETLFKKSGAGGRSNTCKPCDAARAAEYVKQNRDKVSARRRARYRRNLLENRRRSRERARSPRGLEINRAAVARYKANNPDKTLARKKVASALRSGALVKPETCQVQGCKCAGPLHGHHADYNKPLLVDWLCRDHHEKLHHEIKRLPLKASAARKYTRQPKNRGLTIAIAA